MEANWLEVARRELGIHETPGPKATERITEYLKTTTVPKGMSESDETPWCAAFVNWCMIQAGVHGTNSAMAASWRSFGVPCEPKPGAVVVIQQKVQGKDPATGSTSGMHVGFFLEQDAGGVVLLGGNQHDSVKISRFPSSAYLVKAYRWPVQSSS